MGSIDHPGRLMGAKNKRAFLAAHAICCFAVVPHRPTPRTTFLYASSESGADAVHSGTTLSLVLIVVL